MAEFLGAVATASQLTEQVLKIAAFISEIRDAPESIRKQSDQLKELISIAKLIENNPALQTAEVRSTLGSCIAGAKELQEILAGVSTAAGDGNVRKVWKAVVGKTKEQRILGLLLNLERDKSSLGVCIGAINSTLLQTVHDKVPEISRKVVAIHDDMQHLTAPSSLTEEQWQNSCQAALFLTDPLDDRNKLITAKGKRVQGTCEWITTNDTYVSWLGSQSQLLWLSGGPGKGKTMLSIFLTQEFDKLAAQSQYAVSTYFFCENRDDRRRTAVAVLRGLIFQLIRKHPNLLKHIIPVFKVQKETLFGDSSFESLWRIFESMIRDPSLDTVFCVLDGLDECDEDSLEMLIEKLKDFFCVSASSRLNMIVVSRELPDCIPRALSRFARVRLGPDSDQEVNRDLRQFIITKVEELSSEKSYSADLRTFVEKILLERAEGTFLWVSFVIGELRKKARTEVKDCLKHLPTGLDGMYARMLLQIRKERQQIAASILRWVTVAMRPLTLVELTEATGIETSANLSFDEVTEDHIGYCGYLLTVTGDKVGLIHQSAKDYLLRKDPDHNPQLEFFRVKEEETHSEIARKCLKYIQGDAFANAPVEADEKHGSIVDLSYLEAIPLLSYAVHHWPNHAQYSSNSADDTFDLSAPFYAKESLVRELWWKTYLKSTRSGWFPFVYGKGLLPFSPLHFASYFGIIPLAEKLLEKDWKRKFRFGGHFDEKDGSKQTPLFYAARKGHIAMVELLLKYNTDVNARDVNKRTALHTTASFGHENVTQLLLEHKADVNAKDKSGSAALHNAALYGHEKIIQLLLEHKADVNAKDKYGTAALHNATLFGHEKIIQLLLEHKADVNAKDK